MFTNDAFCWDVPTSDPNDEPHIVFLDAILGLRKPDGSALLNVNLILSESGRAILSPDEARRLAHALIIAAAQADEAREVMRPAA